MALKKTLPYMVCALVVAVALLFIPSAAQAEIVFSEDFESPDVSTTSTTQYGGTYHNNIVPNSNWIGATQGFGANRRGVVAEQFGDYTAPPENGAQAYYFGYTNSGITTAEGAIGELVMSATYTASFDIARDNNQTSSSYAAQLIAFGDGVLRDDVRSTPAGSTVLASVNGSVTTNDMSTTVSFQFTSDINYLGELGKDIGFRFLGNSSNPIIDNVTLDVLVPDPLTLEVNTTSGELTILGNPTLATSINYYEITSAGGLSLQDATWLSLADQDFEGNGPPNGSGNGWEEVGGSGAHALAEGYLLGSSSIGAGASINLGYGYDESVNAQDLTFNYRNIYGTIITGDIDYITSLLGDFDGDDDVDLDDIDALTLVGDLSTGVAASSTNALFDLNSDDIIDTADLDLWLSVAATTNGFGSPYLRGDGNLDGDVDVFQLDGNGDAQILSSNLGTPSGAAWSNGDFNGDGDVDVFQFDGGGDAQLLSSNLGSSSDIGGSFIVAVPEPGSLAMLAFSSLAMFVRLRR
jgi:hypothetical protein